MAIQQWLQSVSDPVFSLLILAASVIVGVLVGLFVRRIARRSVEISGSRVASAVFGRLRGPLLVAFPILGATIALTASPFPEAAQAIARQALSMTVVALLTWTGVKGLYILEDSVERNYEIHKADNLQARKVTTQIYYLRRIGVVVVVLIGLSVILSSFEPIQQLGTTLLASAGVAGIIIGVGAQKTVGSVVAGLQVAFTQPIRLDDVLIVENEWGRVEEITLTYVVVRIWDLRRLVLPITYFTERAFQNWTRMTADLLGTVYLYVDYTTPIDPIREELHRVLQQSEHWDGKVWNVQVTDATEKTMELRAMMSAKDASTLWDLRVEVREKLIAFLQSSYSDNLPRTRVRIGEAEVRSVDRSDGAPSDNDTETDDRSRDASGTAPAGYQEGAADHGNAEDGKGDA